MKILPLILLSFLSVTAIGEKCFFDVVRSRPEHYRMLGKGKASWEVRGDKLILTIPSDPREHWPGLIILPQNGLFFDFSGGSVAAVDVRNLNDNPALLQMEALTPGKSREFAYQASGGIGLQPGETATLRLRYHRAGNFGIDWLPGGMLVAFEGFDVMKHHLVPERVQQLRFFIKDSELEQRFELSNFRIENPFRPLPAALKSPESFYPCIDRFGQYKHAEWPGKIHSGEELKQAAAREKIDLARHPGPADRTRFGGWDSGPSYPATGHFYPVKHDGKWFLVDPTGKLFWSLGMNEVSLNAQGLLTGVTRREHFFEYLPPRSTSEERWCYSRYRPRLRWYKEQGLKEIECFNFLRSNLLFKEGKSVKETVAAFLNRTPGRLKSWGFNTVGNWSERRICEQQRIAYADSLYIHSDVIPGDRGWWRQFHEVFSPNFERALLEHIRKYRASALNDPWCIGFFVDNELTWGDDAGLVRGVLRSPASQPSKIAFAEQLKAKYHSIEALNRAWETHYSSWENFLQTTRPPDEKKAWKDMTAFNTEMIHLYFSKIRRTIKSVAPHKLYLGCRFPNDYNRNVVKIAANYVDILSFNLYKYSVATFRLPEGVDKPVIIGEWHFGTQQYGPPNPGLCSTADQNERARAFDRYLRSALWNPYIVGAHYFALYDQTATGRPNDCENMQFGFLSITDIPYPEMVAASRKISAELYQLRK